MLCLRISRSSAPRILSFENSSALLVYPIYTCISLDLVILRRSEHVSCVSWIMLILGF
ncbi:hypothetical protein ACSS6W_004031 [Trichoderma asperelloides]